MVKYMRKIHGNEHIDILHMREVEDDGYSGLDYFKISTYVEVVKLLIWITIIINSLDLLIYIVPDILIIFSSYSVSRMSSPHKAPDIILFYITIRILFFVSLSLVVIFADQSMVLIFLFLCIICFILEITGYVHLCQKCSICEGRILSSKDNVISLQECSHICHKNCYNRKKIKICHCPICRTMLLLQDGDKEQDQNQNQDRVRDNSNRNKYSDRGKNGMKLTRVEMDKGDRDDDGGKDRGKDREIKIYYTDECCICHSNFSAINSDETITECGHKYHTECINPIIKEYYDCEKCSEEAELEAELDDIEIDD